MQAHPLSSPAARIPSTSSPTPSRTPRSASIPTSDLADTGGLAHDARNLLGALGLYCDLLSAAGVLRPEHRHYATELRYISDRSSRLIQRMLAIPSAPTTTSSQAENFASAHDHAAMLHSLAPVLQRIADGAATVTVTCPASLPPLDFPSEIIERIIVNLVRNAAEAIRSNTHNKRSNTRATTLPAPDEIHSEVRGKIHVTLSVLSSRLQLTVEDNGPGMPPAIAAAFLQPSPLPRGATRGLGHRIIHELATASAGQLSVRVRPSKGTVFCLKWPIPASGPSTPSAKTAQEGSSTC